ncbi:MAG: hypothetical protein HRT44_13885 [Bdellovibrionales bacterium]|nr:hypothetical protein [Bdellovibrionales bacterium]
MDSLAAENKLRRDEIDTINREVHRGQRSHEDLISRTDNTMIVVGGGPMGMITALLGYKSGRNVMIIEKRSRYERDEIMGLDPQFFKLIQDNFPELIREMLNLGILIPRPGWADLRPENARDENFYSIRIQQLEHSFSLLYDRIVQSRRGASIQMLRGYELVDFKPSRFGWRVNLVDQSGNPAVFQSKMLIGVDGFSGRSTQSQTSMTYTTQQPTIKGLFRATDVEQADRFSRRWDGRNLRQILNHHPQRESFIGELKTLGWRPEELGLDSNTLPSFRIFQNGDQFYIASTISPSLAQAMKDNPQLSRDWFLKLREYIFPQYEIRGLTLREETIGRIDPELRAMDDPVLVETNTLALFFALGDRAANAHYMTRSGINSGSRHVMSFYESVLSLNPLQLRGAELTPALDSYRRVVEQEFNTLLRKATTRGHFRDAGFVERLSGFQLSIGRDLQFIAGLNHVHYHHIRDMQSAGYSPRYRAHQKGLEATAQRFDPTTQWPQFLDYFQKQLYTEL